MNIDCRCIGRITDRIYSRYGSSICYSCNRRRGWRRTDRRFFHQLWKKSTPEPLRICDDKRRIRSICRVVNKDMYKYN